MKVAEAPLVGGCLTLLCSSIGTPYEVETEGRILLVEDLNTDPYLVDTGINHLRLAGKLDGIAGFAFGTSVNLTYQTLPEGPESTLSVEEILDELIAPLGIRRSPTSPSATASTSPRCRSGRWRASTVAARAWRSSKRLWRRDEHRAR